MEVRPGEAVALIIRRNDLEPFDYCLTARKSESSFDEGSKDFHLHGAQEVILGMQKDLTFDIAVEQAIIGIKDF
jgi:hypothetical protein